MYLSFLDIARPLNVIISPFLIRFYQTWLSPRMQDSQYMEVRYYCWSQWTYHALWSHVRSGYPATERDMYRSQARVVQSTHFSFRLLLPSLSLLVFRYICVCNTSKKVNQKRSCTQFPTEPWSEKWNFNLIWSGLGWSGSKNDTLGGHNASALDTDLYSGGKVTNKRRYSILQDKFCDNEKNKRIRRWNDRRGW